MKKIAIIYYSMSGNTEYVAKYISEKINADLIKIAPKKEYPHKGLKKFFWGGKSAVMGETPELEEYQFDYNKYDKIIIGTPVWASTFAPPIRTFINDNKDELQKKSIAVFICYSGAGAEKTIEKMKKYLGVNELAAKLTLMDPKMKQTEENLKKIDCFCKEILK